MPERNRTIQIDTEEAAKLERDITTPAQLADTREYDGTTINGDVMDVLPLLPDHFADLIIIDPPYNLDKDFGTVGFRAKSESDYEDYVMSWLPAVCRKLGPSGSLYLCGDWHCTSALQRCLGSQLTILNRITWQREKGRGAKANWKNSMEDIWFAVANADDYYFDLEAVKQRRRVVAPYRENGKPKDWEQTATGNFRLTCPSNFWDDISVPFWSMGENTPHPTQKAEKLYAKLILASCPEGGIVFDPFLGSGTASVVAKKLGRRYCGVEIDPNYCLYAAKRLREASSDKAIQGYASGVFWERNTAREQNAKRIATRRRATMPSLFD